MGYFFIILSLVFLIFGVAAYVRVPKIDVINVYWEKEQFNTTGFKRALKKIYGGVVIFLGLVLGLFAFAAIQNANQDKAEQEEAVALGISLQEYKAYSCTKLYIPKDTTYDQYRLVDAEGRSKGFKNGCEYVILSKRASDAGVTLEQYVQQHPTESSAVSDGQAFVVIPEGAFYTDRGQVSKAVYRAACLKALPDYKNTAIAVKLGYSSEPKGKLIANLGESAISKAKIWWDDSYGCLGSFEISGMVEGGNHIIPMRGKIESFTNYGGNVRGIISTY